MLLRIMIWLSVAWLPCVSLASPSVAQTVLRLNYQSLTMPAGHQDMGMFGLGYYWQPTPAWYAGIQGYGAIAGDRGGLFTFGIGAGWLHDLTTRWTVDVGLTATAGGGKNFSNEVGGGLLLNPYAGVLWRVRPALQAGLYYAYSQFSSGQIQSHQLSVALSTPVSVLYDHFLHEPASVSTASSGWRNRVHAIRFFLDQYQLRDQARLRMVGVNFVTYITQRWSSLVSLAGAFDGGASGYMEVLAGIGWQEEFVHRVTGWWQVLVGSGGGGGRETGGGLLYKTRVGLTGHVSPWLQASLYGGYVQAAAGHFSGSVYGVDLGYVFSTLALRGEVAGEIEDLTASHWRLRLMNQAYFRPQRLRVDLAQQSIQLINFDIERVLTPAWSIIGQAGSAYGGNAGSYSTGMVGLGAALSLDSSWSLFAQMLVGAGGGGGIATAGGAIVQPLIGLDYWWSDWWGVTAAVGRVRSLRGQLNSSTAVLGVVARFSLPGAS